MTDTILIKKGGCSTRVTLTKYNQHYKRAGYVIVEDEKQEEYDINSMSYQELQALYSKKTGGSAVGVSKVDLIERLNEVL